MVPLPHVVWAHSQLPHVSEENQVEWERHMPVSSASQRVPQGHVGFLQLHSLVLPAQQSLGQLEQLVPLVQLELHHWLQWPELVGETPELDCSRQC